MSCECVFYLVVVGGGFVGFWVICVLVCECICIILVDCCNYYLFQLLLYQVVIVGLFVLDIVVLLCYIFGYQCNVEVCFGEVVVIDKQVWQICMVDGSMLDYDSLLLVIGVIYVYFGNDQWVDDVFGLKMLDDVIVLCCKLLLVFECVEVELDLVKKVVWLSFVIVGGGFIGVELVGILVEIVCYMLCNEFCYIDLVSVKVWLVEVGLCVLFLFLDVFLLKVCC